MDVKLAGYNLDTLIINKLGRQALTPETISAAYARISRSKKSVRQLREQSINEVDKARTSNERIVFDMGHSSIAEHAVFNFDIVGISRYLTETVQKSRLASFTEKSQRYVTFEEQVVAPAELDENPTLKKKFTATVSKLYRLYKEISIDIERSINPGRVSQLQLSEKAKEDARYVLPLATKTQMGMTINARNLEGLLRRLAGIKLKEAEELHKRLLSESSKIAPSLIRYAQDDGYGCLEEIRLKTAEFELTDAVGMEILKSLETTVIPLSENGEDDIIAALLFENNPQPYKRIISTVKNMDKAEKEKIFAGLLKGIGFYHKAPHYFEVVDCLIQLSVSACCFAQLKRHRMATIIKSHYHPAFGFVTPPSIEKIESLERYSQALSDLTLLYQELENYRAGLGNYILTNAHRRNVLFKANLRELYHFSRLRSDKHAQWEIRNQSKIIDRQLKKLYPNACSMVKGKSEICSS